MTAELSAGWVETELGRLLVACTEAGVCFVDLQPDLAEQGFEKWRQRVIPDSRVVATSKVLDEARDELASYARGERRAFDVPQDLFGTDFQRSVWFELKRIPYGATCTYGQVARAIDNPGATRAVGLANNRNPVPIMVPCHRVVAAGGLGGFGGGVEMKHRLLALEGVHLAF